MRFLVIDDLRVMKSRHEMGGDVETEYARTSEEGIAALGKWSDLIAVSLDHDLGGNDTTMPCVDFIVQNPEHFGMVSIFVHTSNPYAGDMIVAQLESAGLWPVRVDAARFFDIDYTL